MSRTISALVLGALLAVPIVSTQSKHALSAPVTYTSESAWLTDIGGTTDYSVDFNTSAGTSFAGGAIADFGAFSLQGTSSDLNTVTTGGGGDVNGSAYAYLYTPTDSSGNPDDTVTMSFATPTTAWGADFADASVVQMILTYADSSTEPIDVPVILTPGFFGFTSSLAVTSILFQASSTGSAGEGFGIDNVAGTSAVIPLPAALPLLLSALGIFGIVGWRRKKAVAA